MKQARTPLYTTPLVGTPPRTLAALPRERDAQWTMLCERRLAELSPGSKRDALHELAVELCAELRHFDPVMAAEMEHEGGMLHD